MAALRSAPGRIRTSDPRIRSPLTSYRKRRFNKLFQDVPTCIVREFVTWPSSRLCCQERHTGQDATIWPSDGVPPAPRVRTSPRGLGTRHGAAHPSGGEAPAPSARRAVHRVREPAAAPRARRVLNSDPARIRRQTEQWCRRWVVCSRQPRVWMIVMSRPSPEIRRRATPALGSPRPIPDSASANIATGRPGRLGQDAAKRDIYIVF